MKAGDQLVMLIDLPFYGLRRGQRVTCLRAPSPSAIGLDDKGAGIVYNDRVRSDSDKEMYHYVTRTAWVMLKEVAPANPP